jgi:hypothetical protein
MNQAARIAMCARVALKVGRVKQVVQSVFLASTVEPEKWEVVAVVVYPANIQTNMVNLFVLDVLWVGMPHFLVLQSVHPVTTTHTVIVHLSLLANFVPGPMKTYPTMAIQHVKKEIGKQLKSAGKTNIWIQKKWCE